MIADFTPEQLKVIGSLVVTFGVSFITLVWKVATWKAHLERDVDNLGAILETEKGLALLKKRQEKKCKK